MMNEKARYHSYSFGWPHDKMFIDTKILAKTGLYFTGNNDCVMCAFCNIKLHSWNNTDNPIFGHFKYSPNCRFLSNPENTSNVVVGCCKELNRMLSVLINCVGFDRVGGGDIKSDAN